MRTALRGAGELLITFGIILLLFCAYELWGTSLYTQRQQHRLNETLQQRWDSQPAPSSTPAATTPARSKPPYRYPDVPVGESFAVIWIPKLGDDYNYAIIQGAGPEQLKRGPGHYLGANGTAMPGQVGNFVVSGHRTTYLAPFNRVDELAPGDAVIVETADTWFTYRVDRKDIVPPNAVEVTAAVPFHPGRSPNRRRITLTTCHPKYSARQRLIVFGTLASARDKAAGQPKVLARQGGGR